MADIDLSSDLLLGFFRGTGLTASPVLRRVEEIAESIPVRSSITEVTESGRRTMNPNGAGLQEIAEELISACRAGFLLLSAERQNWNGVLHAYFHCENLIRACDTGRDVFGQALAETVAAGAGVRPDVRSTWGTMACGNDLLTVPDRYLADVLEEARALTETCSIRPDWVALHDGLELIMLGRRLGEGEVVPRYLMRAKRVCRSAAAAAAKAAESAAAASFMAACERCLRKVQRQYGDQWPSQDTWEVQKDIADFLKEDGQDVYFRVVAETVPTGGAGLTEKREGPLYLVKQTSLFALYYGEAVAARRSAYYARFAEFILAAMSPKVSEATNGEQRSERVTDAETVDAPSAGTEGGGPSDVREEDGGDSAGWRCWR